MSILEMPLQIESDDAQTSMSIKIQQFYGHHGMKPIVETSYSPTGQAIIGRPTRTLKEMLIEQNGEMVFSKDGLKCALLTSYIILKANETKAQLLRYSGF